MSRKIDGVGIDFGTYNTKIALFQKGVSTTLRLRDIARPDGSIASFLYMRGDRAEIGNKALKRWKKGDKNVHFRFKLNMFRQKEAERHAITFLQTLKEHLLMIDGFSDIPFRFTHPNGWTAVEIGKFRDIIVRSGFDVTSRFSCREPYAAGVWMLGLHNRTGGHFLVVDAGAGTLDISIVRADDGSIEVREEMDACREQAGSHIDEMIASHILDREVRYENPEDRRFLSEVEVAKIEINRGAEFYEIGDKELDRRFIREACGEFVSGITDILEDVRERLTGARISLEGIIPAGGSGNLFLIIEAIEKVFPEVSVLRPQTLMKESDDSIVLGAAQAAAGFRRIRECTKHPVCIAFRSGFVLGLEDLPHETMQQGEKILIEVFPKNMPLPAKKKLDRLAGRLKLAYSSYPSIEFFIMKYPLGEIKKRNMPLNHKTVLHKRLWTARAHGDDLEKLGEMQTEEISFDIEEDEDRIVHIVLKGRGAEGWMRINSYEIGQLEKKAGS
jgi:actin-like ATPase involved in cell morphogenesis